MSAPPSTVAPSTFEPPGADGGLLISRSAEADRITTFITTKKARLMVLCGAEESGKTVLITHWLLPAAFRKADRRRRRIQRLLWAVQALAARGVVGSRRTSTVRRRLMTRKTIMVVDEFDWVLDLPRDERRSH